MICVIEVVMEGAGAGLLRPAHRLELLMLTCSSAGGYAGVACLLSACPQAAMVRRPLQPACQPDIRPGQPPQGAMQTELPCMRFWSQAPSQPVILCGDSTGGHARCSPMHARSPRLTLVAVLVSWLAGMM